MIMSAIIAVGLGITYFNTNLEHPELIIAASIFWFAGKVGKYDG